jgi:hypothetical protein
VVVDDVESSVVVLGPAFALATVTVTVVVGLSLRCDLMRSVMRPPSLPFKIVALLTLISESLCLH